MLAVSHMLILAILDDFVLVYLLIMVELLFIHPFIYHFHKVS